MNIGPIRTDGFAEVVRYNNPMPTFTCKMCKKRFESNSAYAYKKGRKTCSILCRNRYVTHYMDKEKFRRNAALSKLGSKNPNWKGKNVTYGALHGWMRNHMTKLDFCEKCKKVPPYDLANISQKYLRELSDWEWLCRRCHMLKDGRLDRLHLANR